MAAQAQGNHFQLAPSAGTYGYVPEVTYFFGLPRSIVPGGAEMDLDHISIVTSTPTQGLDASIAFTMQLGALSSALEHAVPEQMFITEDAPGEAVSAVKALQKASSQGQRIYHITPANQTTALPNIRHNALVMNEIRAALAVGRDVIVHTDPISVPGWTGAGYVIYDPGTGAGAWKIGGGANGGFLKQLNDTLSLLWSALLDGVQSVAEDLAMHLNKVLGEVAKTLSLLGKLLDHMTSIMELAETCTDIVAFYAATMFMTFFVIIGLVLAAVTAGPLGLFIVSVAASVGLYIALQQFKRACSI